MQLLHPRSIPARARPQPWALVLLLLTSACATGSSPSFTMAPIFFSETASPPVEVRSGDAAGAPALAVASTSGPTMPDARFILAAGNALLPAGSAIDGASAPLAITTPFPTLPGPKPGLVLASLAPFNAGATIMPAGPTVGATIGAGAVSVQARIDVAVIGGVASTATSAVAMLVAPVASGVAAIVPSVVTPLAGAVTATVGAPGPDTMAASVLTVPVVATVPNIATPVTTAVAAITAPVVAPVAALTAPVAAAVSPIVKPVATAVTATTGASLAPIIAALPMAGQPLAVTPLLLAAGSQPVADTINLRSGVVAVSRNCLIGNCR